MLSCLHGLMAIYPCCQASSFHPPPSSQLPTFLHVLKSTLSHLNPLADQIQHMQHVPGELQESQPRAQFSVSLPPTQNTYTTESKSTHPGRVGSYRRLLQKLERGKKAVGQQLLQGRVTEVQRGGRNRGKKTKNKLKRRQKGAAGIQGLHVCLPSSQQPAQEREGRVGVWFVGCLFFGVTHGRKHIRCKRSRSCHLSGHGRRHKCLWSCKPPCGSQHQPVCQRLAPRR